MEGRYVSVRYNLLKHEHKAVNFSHFDPHQRFPLRGEMGDTRDL